MADDLIRDELASLIARVLGIRDVVSRLVAYEASRHSDHEGLFRHISDATASNIYRTEKKDGRPPSRETMILQEQIQNEVDTIVAEARRIMAAGLK